MWQSESEAISHQSKLPSGPGGRPKTGSITRSSRPPSPAKGAPSAWTRSSLMMCDAWDELIGSVSRQLPGMSRSARQHGIVAPLRLIMSGSNTQSIPPQSVMPLSASRVFSDLSGRSSRAASLAASRPFNPIGHSSCCTIPFIEHSTFTAHSSFNI
jgi:hypothetical protein